MPEGFDQLPPSFDGTVRLFPLPDTVLFPSNIMPLHIFEPRYKEMFEQAIQTDGLIAMATLTGVHSSSDTEDPEIYPTVCIGKIGAHETTKKATYVFNLVGLSRAVILHEEKVETPFRAAKVDLISDRYHLVGQPRREFERRIVQLIELSVPQASKVLQDYREHRVSFSALVDILSFHLDFDVDTKLRILNEHDVLLRAQALSQAVLGHHQLMEPAPDFYETNVKRRYPPSPFSDN